MGTNLRWHRKFDRSGDKQQSQNSNPIIVGTNLHWHRTFDRSGDKQQSQNSNPITLGINLRWHRKFDIDIWHCNTYTDFSPNYQKGKLLQYWKP